VQICRLIISRFLMVIAGRSARLFAHEIVRLVVDVIVAHFAKMAAKHIATVAHLIKI
jgi:hypothetical protein